MDQQLSPEEVIRIIAKEKSLSEEEVNDMVNEMRQNLDNMINMQGAAYLLAHNLGVNISPTKTPIDSQEVKITDIVHGMGLITVQGRISRIHKKHTFTRKDGNVSQVRNIDLIDDTGSIRIAFWDTKAQLIEEQNLDLGSIIRINGAEPKLGYQDQVELTVGSKATIVTNLVGVDSNIYPEINTIKPINISDITAKMESVTIIGKIVEIRPVNEFERSDGTIGKVCSITVLDTTGNIRITFWDKLVEIAQKFKVNEIHRFTDVKVSENNQNTIELVYQGYSSANKEENKELESLEYTSEFGEAKQLEISEITEESKNYTLICKVIGIDEVKTFDSEKFTGKLQSLTVRDNSGSIRVNLWGNSVDKISNLNTNDIIKITNLYTKHNDYSQSLEANTGNFSTIEINPADIEKIDIEENFILFKDIQSNEPAVSMKVKLVEKLEVREITRKDQTTAQVININVVDEAGERGRVTAWDNDIKNFDDFVEGQDIELKFARAKRDDYGVNLTVGRNTQIQSTSNFKGETLFSTADQLNTNTETLYVTKIRDLVDDTRVKVEAVIVKIFDKIGFYKSCSECLKKVDEEIDGTTTCKTHGEVKSKMRMIITLVLDDSTETISAKFFADNAEKLLGMSGEEAFEMKEKLGEDSAPVKQQKNNIIMKEISIIGRTKLNEKDDKLELTVNQFNMIDYQNKTDEIFDRFEQYLD
jgi:replication factor A1